MRYATFPVALCIAIMVPMQAACPSEQAEQQQPTSSTNTAAAAAQGWQQAAKPEGADKAEQECKEELHNLSQSLKVLS
jgi:hypothetical protein